MTTAEFLEVLVSLSLQVAVLVIAAHWVAKLTSRDAVKSQLWAGCHLLILGMTLRAFILPRLRSVQLWPRMDSATALEVVVWQERIGLALLTLWIIGAVCSLGIFLLGWHQVRRFLQTCQPVEDAALLEQLSLGTDEEARSNLSPQFFMSPRLQSPFCWQVHHPMIVLPEYLLDFEAEELRLIVRHEMEHLQTGHPLTLFVQRIVEIVFWFHPMVWWSSRQAGLAREFACDEAAVNSRRDIANYLRSLLKIVERTEDESESQSIELAFGRGRGMIARRAARLVMMARQGVAKTASQRMPKSYSLLLSIVAVVIAMFLWMPLGLATTQTSTWSPWPTWSAETLHAFGVHARDYDIGDHRYQIQELLEDQRESEDESNFARRK